MTDVAQRFVVARRQVLGGGVAVLPAVLLIGCASLIGPKPAARLYVLAPPIPQSPIVLRVKWQLAVALPDARASLDTIRIALRQSPTTMDYFADAAWPDRLPLLIQDLLIESFENSGRIFGVARDSSGITANYRLDTELRQFDAYYDQVGGAPRIIVRMEAKLAALPERNIVGSLRIVQEARAQQNNLNSIVVAFNEAGGMALQQIVDWTFQLLPNDKTE